MVGLEHRDRDTRRVVIVGGGVAALEAAVALGALAPGLVHTTVVSRDDTYVDRPLTLGQRFGFGHPRRFPIARICGAVGAELVLDAAQQVEPDAHRLRLASGATMEYDLLLLAVGGRPYPAFENGTTFDPELSPQDFDEVLFDLDDGLAPHIAVVVPDGVAWTLPAYELALLTADHAERRHPDRCVVTLVTHEARPLEAFGPTVAEAMVDLLSRGHVSVRTGVHADVVTDTALRAGGGWIRADRIVSLPRMVGPHLTGVPADMHGFIPVDPFGRVVGLEDVYAAGDGTASSIKQGGIAAQQADAVANAIAARAGADIEPRPLQPVLRGLLATRHGPRYLRAELDDPETTSTIADEPLWWPPSKIASRWLAPLLARLDLERAPDASVPA
jgi:sulfide:quinone oxidoreductase